MITLHVVVSNTTSLKVITEGRGVRNWSIIAYVICEWSLNKGLFQIEFYVQFVDE